MKDLLLKRITSRNRVSANIKLLERKRYTKEDGIMIEFGNESVITIFNWSSVCWDISKFNKIN